MKKKLKTSSEAPERVEEIEVKEVQRRKSSEDKDEDYYYEETEDYNYYTNKNNSEYGYY